MKLYLKSATERGEDENTVESQSETSLPDNGSADRLHTISSNLKTRGFMHWRRKWQPVLVFLPGESRGPGSLVGCCLWGRTESDMTEVT